MTRAAVERDFWDAEAADNYTARRAVLGEVHRWDWSIRYDLERIVPAITPGAVDVLDYGSGVGRLAGAVQELGYQVTGVDISERMVAHARRETAGMGRPPRFVVGDGRSIPAEVADASIDFAYSVAVLQHIPVDGQAAVVAAVARVLRPGGRFRFQTVHSTDPGPYSHPVTDDQVTEMVHRAGLQLVDVEYGDHERPTWRWVTAAFL